MRILLCFLGSFLYAFVALSCTRVSLARTHTPPPVRVRVRVWVFDHRNARDRRTGRRGADIDARIDAITKLQAEFEAGAEVRRPFRSCVSPAPLPFPNGACPHMGVGGDVWLNRRLTSPRL